jgi:hypothetical protein
MPSSPTDLAQSFRLRFWREPRRGAADQWRGTIWHEQQRPFESPTAINDPEEAFDLVRRILSASLRTGDAKRQPTEEARQKSGRICFGSLGQFLLILSARFSHWRRNRGGNR